MQLFQWNRTTRPCEALCPTPSNLEYRKVTGRNCSSSAKSCIRDLKISKGIKETWCLKIPRFENVQIKVCCAAPITSCMVTAFTYQTYSTFILEIINILIHLRSMFSFYRNQSRDIK